MSTLTLAATRTSDFFALTKPRVNSLVVLTTMGGFYLGLHAETNLLTLLNTLMGTGFVAAGAAALNQVYERDVDSLMRRTRMRPLPDGRLAAGEARWFALGLSGAGLLQLALGANLLAALVALVTLISYAAIYTPLKRLTPLSTVIGAIPGALPPMIGWAAARGTLDVGGWVLFGIVFIWQLPHFLAIAWIYREDYARAGFPMLPVMEPDGRSTSRQALAWTVALVPVSLLPSMVGLAGRVYFVGAFALSITFLLLAIRFARTRQTIDARRLFFGSLIYLPLIWALMIAGHLGF